MHPELLRALGQARHEDLLRKSRNRGQSSLRPDHHLPRFTRSRQRVGSLLIWAGARLIDDQRVVLELSAEKR
jgi:hypothetical protein